MAAPVVPARHVAGNLIWTWFGDCWGLWRVPPLGTAATTKAARELWDRTRGALRAAVRTTPSGDAMLLSLCSPVDHVGVVERCVEGFDLACHPGLCEQAEADLDRLENLAMYERATFVAVRLPSTARRSLAAIAASASASTARAFGLPPAPVSAGEVELRARQADAAWGLMAQHVSLRDATADEVAWVYARAARRGFADEPSCPEPPDPTGRVPASTAEPAMLGPARLRGLGEATIRGRGQHVTVGRDNGSSVWHSLLVLASMPERFWFPGGGEWLSRADDLPFPVDWCVRLWAQPNEEAKVAARRQETQLMAQLDEHDQDLVGAPPDLGQAIDGIRSEREALAANASESKLRATFVYGVWADDPRLLEERVGALRAFYEAAEFGMPRPFGDQAELWKGVMPGAPMPRAARDYAQFLLAGALAGGMPFVGAELGDRSGMLLGFSAAGGCARPVLLDPSWGPRHQRGGDMALLAAPGAGKSYTGKRIAKAVLDRGGRFLALDCTEAAEWVRFARVLPGGAQVVSVDEDAPFVLDPLRMLAGSTGRQLATGFVCTLLQVAPNSEEGAACTQAVRAVAERPEGCMADVIAELAHMAERASSDHAARSCARRLEAFADEPLGRLVFGHGPPLSLAADCIVFHFPGLALPDEDTQRSEHLARQMQLPQLLSQALLLVVAGITRHVAFSDPRFVLQGFDEVYELTYSAPGKAMLRKTIRDGRKHNAATLLMSQHPLDVGDRQMSDLIPVWLLMRQSKGSARRSLEVIGADVTDEAVAQLVAFGTGQGLLRDQHGNLGPLRVADTGLPALEVALDTNAGPTAAATGGPVETVAAETDRRPRLAFLDPDDDDEDVDDDLGDEELEVDDDDLVPA